MRHTVVPCSPELAVALESEVVQMQNFLEKQGHGSSVSVTVEATMSLAVSCRGVVQYSRLHCPLNPYKHCVCILAESPPFG